MLRILILLVAVLAVAAALPYPYYSYLTPYSAVVPAIPQPYAYETAPAVHVHAEPVEQHGYQIVY